MANPKCEQGFKRPWPALIKMDEVVKAKLEQIWRSSMKPCEFMNHSKAN